MIKKHLTIVKIRFPTGREEEIIGRDYAALTMLKKAFEKGACIVEKRKDLYTLSDAEFKKVATFIKNTEREVIK